MANVAVLRDLALLAAQATETTDEGFELTDEVVVNFLSIAAPAIVLTSSLITWLRGRAARALTSTNPPFEVLRLRTKNPGWTVREWDSFTRYAFGLSPVLFAIYAGWLVARTGELDSFFTWLLVAEVVCFVIFGLTYWHDVRGVKPGEPVKSCSAEFVVQGDFAAVVKHCQTAMLQLGAFAPEDVLIASNASSRALLWGRTGSLLTEATGERIVIGLTAAEAEAELVIVHLESATLKPRLFGRGANRRNVRRLMESLV